jgi:hypothetical protein
MKISHSHNEKVTISLADSKSTDENTRTASDKKHQKGSKVIFAGDLNLNEDSAVNKRLQAKRQAMRTLMDQYHNDKEIDNQVSELKEKQRKLLKDAALAADQVKNHKALKYELKASYGIEDNSLEQKNLELLEKSIYSPGKLTEEEAKQLKKMGPLTDYQKAALKNDAMQNIWQQRIDAAATDVMNIDRSIVDIALERLKTHPMIDAQKEAAQILEAASKEVIATLLQEGKENIDHTAEENKKEVQERQEEQDEETTSASGDNTEAPGLSLSEQTSQLQLADELKQFVQKQSLSEEDLKGLLVDETL